MKKLLALCSLFLLAGAMILPLSGCREEGEGERLGRELDKAAEETQEAAEDLLDR